MGTIRIRTLNIDEKPLKELIRSIMAFVENVDVRSQSVTVERTSTASVHVYGDTEENALGLVSTVEAWATRHRIRATVFTPEGQVVRVVEVQGRGVLGKRG